jgi:hypothetical protein
VQRDCGLRPSGGIVLIQAAPISGKLTNLLKIAP